MKVIDFVVPLIRKTMTSHAYALKSGRTKWVVEREAEKTIDRLERVGISRRQCLEELADLLEENK